MNTSLENSNLGYVSNNGFEFINAVPYLDELFSKNTITLITTSVVVEQIFSSKLNERIVKCADEKIEWNLRAVESYFPEILLALSVVDSISLLDGVEQLSGKGFPYTKKEFSINFLHIKLYHFFEAVLFGNFFDNVFCGVSEDKCFVIKEMGSLQYYRLYEARRLIKKLFAKSTLRVIPYKQEELIYYPLQFHFSL